MAYADQPMSTRKMASIVIVGLLHVVLGYAFVTGLAYQVIKQAPTVLETFDVKEAKPPEEELPPPPPEPEAPPPPMAPPPAVVIAAPSAPPPVIVSTIPSPPPPPTITPPEPPRPAVTQRVSPRGNRASWVTTDDYPGSSLRANEEGTTGIRVDVGADGRVTSCSVTSSSGSSTLDDTTCRVYTRRARFNPQKDGSGNAVAAAYNDRVRWQIPKD